MSLFKNLTDDGLEESKDTLGGSFGPLETDIYTGTIKAAYAGESRSGAMSVSIIADFDGHEYKETLYVTNRKKENFYKNQNGKKVPLPGYNVANDLCLIASDKPLSEQETEEKVIELWDFDAGKNLPTKVPMLMDLIGKKFSAAIVKQIVDKNTQNSAGDWVPSGETREENEISKIFHPELRITVVEAQNGNKDPKFWEAWLTKNQGKTRNKAKGADSSGTVKSTSGNAPKAKKSLFG